MSYCLLLLWLSALLLLLVLLPWWGEWLVRSPLGERFRRYCPHLCRLWVVVAFVLGLVAGGLVYACADELWSLVRADACRRSVLLALVLLNALAFCLVMQVARCGWSSIPTLYWPTTKSVARSGFSAWWLILLLAALILYWVWKCCGGISAHAIEWTPCVRLVAAAVTLVFLLATTRFLALRLCEDHKGHECKRSMRRWVLAIIVAEIATAVLIYRCCEALKDRDFDLAMVAIWWDGAHAGDERGVHLRWSFRYRTETLPGLAFPEQGFDIERRESNGGAWTTINPERIHPAEEWGDETNVTPGEMWRPRAVDRLHPDDWNQFRGEPFDELLETLSLAPYELLYYVEEPTSGSVFPPALPFTTEADRDAWLAAYDAQLGDQPPLATWEFEPLGTILTAAMHNEIARLVGLAYVDMTAPADVEFDYRIVGYWTDRTRRYTVSQINAANTADLGAPLLDVVESPLPIGTLSGEPIVDDRSVGLSWTPPDNASPPVIDDAIDTIKPVLFQLEHQAVFVVPDEGVEDLASLGSCALPVDESAFGPAQRPDGEVMAPIAVGPLEDEDESLSWPKFFAYHRGLPYGCHAYRVIGEDVFGRLAPASSARVREVRDLTGPPPPTMTRVQVFQRADSSLPQAVRDEHFAATSDHEYSIQVSWVLPAELSARAPDLHDFRVYAVLPNFEPFPGEGPSSDPPVWLDAASWTAGPIGEPMLLASALPLPTAYADLDFGGATPLAGAQYFEVRFTDVSLAALGISMEDLGLEVRELAGDQKPVRYAWFGVAAVDRPPYTNVGDVTPPVLGVARDLYKPDPPAPPALSGGPFEADDEGNRSLEVSTGLDALYTSNFYRLDALSVTIETDIDPSELPTCFTFPEPVRPPDATDDEWLDIQRRRAVHETIAKNLATSAGEFARMSPLPVEPHAAVVSFLDSVDGTVTGEYLYATTAVDEAGNTSALSCPSPVIVVEDGIAPRIPVFRKALGADRSVVLTWNVNTESDLALYNVYRGRDDSPEASRRKLRWVASLRPDATDDPVRLPDTANGTVDGSGPYASITFADLPVNAGSTYYYRLDAVDTAGNRSRLSEPVGASAFDATPPGPLAWRADAFEVAADSSSVTLRWDENEGDPNLRIQLQRRPAGTALWHTPHGWLAAGTLEFEDDSVASSQTYAYRIRGMDGSGNRGEIWSPVLTVEVPAR